MSEPLRVEVLGGTYTVIMGENGELRALRSGRHWDRDLAGDNLVLGLATELHKARERIKELELQLQARG